MTTAAMFLETVSLNDDAPSSGGGRVNANGDVDGLEAQRFSLDSKMHSNSKRDPIGGSDSDDDDDGSAAVVVVVDAPPLKPQMQQPRAPAVSRPLLPPLRVPPRNDDDEEEYMRDYVDPTLFSPEVSRRAVEIARGRAKTLEMELKELALLEDEQAPPLAGTKLSPAEAVGIISSAFLASLSRVRQLVASSGEKEYDLLSGSSPSSRLDDLDTDGDGLQISPDGSKGAGKHFQATHRPALKRVSAYSSLEKDKKAAAAAASAATSQRPKKRIVWHEEVLDQDEEFYDDEDAAGSSPGAAPSPLASPSGETEALMEVSGPQSVLHYKNDRLTPRSKKKRKKLVKGFMRRLTPSEKEALYRQRPDLMIIPNWAQKYRQGLEDDESSRWSVWLVAIIGTLAVLLIVLIILIARERAAAAT